LSARPRGRRDLEEEIEAQEGQDVGSRQRASTLQTIRTDKASKVPASQRAVSIVSAMMPSVRSQQGRTPGGPGLRVTGVPRADGIILRGVVASRGSRLASAGPRETRRTPGSAAGCNKPASLSAEKPGEVVRNHAVGTGLSDWHPKAEGDEPRLVSGSGRAKVLRKKVQSRRRGDGPGVRGNPATGPTPGEEIGVSRSGQQEGSSEGEPKSGSMVWWQQCQLTCDAVRKTSKVRPVRRKPSRW